MKIQTRLLLTIIPVVLITNLISSLFINIVSSRALDNQLRNNAKALTNSYATQVNSTLERYIEVSSDLANNVITSIHIETLLKSTLRSHPEFSQIYYTTKSGYASDMAIYNKDYLYVNFSVYQGWQDALSQSRITISEPGYYFDEKAVLIFAPAKLAYLYNQEPSVEGIVVLVLPIESIVSSIDEKEAGNFFLLDIRQNIIYNRDPQLEFSGTIDIISIDNDLSSIEQAMESQNSGFGTFYEERKKRYLAFSPIITTNWSFAIYGDYKTITNQIIKLNFVIFLGLIFGVIVASIIIYFVVHSVVHPIEILTNIAKKIAAGDRSITSAISTTSEVGELSESINLMVEELRNKQADLEDQVKQRTIDLVQTVEELNFANNSLQEHRDNLELRVEERTQDLYRANAYIDNVVNSMPSALIAVNIKGVVTHWNKTAEEYSGILAEMAIGNKLDDLIAHFKEEMDNIQNSIINMEQYIRIDAMRDPKISKFKYETITVFPIIDPDQCIANSAVIRIDDTTERVELERSLNQSQKLDALGQLASGIAHDFNNMLGGIIGSSELLVKILKSDKKGLMLNSLILDSAEKAAQLTEKLLTFSYKGERTFQAVDISKTIEQAVALLSRTLDKKIEIKSMLEAEYSIVNGDASLLQNCIINLGINASQAIKKEVGLLEFKTENIEVDHDSDPNIKLNSIKISIIDNGVGITQDDLSHIFEPFFTTKEQGKGTGLGLAAVYGTIKQHNGSISVNSEVGVGTIFEIILPISNKLTVKEEKEDIVLGSGTILLVDDERIIREIATELLTDLGYRVIIAKNGLEAVDIYNAKFEEIDIVILDMIMPKMAGRPCYMKLKEINSNAKILIASGYSKDIDIEDLLEDKNTLFIKKPYHETTLSQTIDTLSNQ